jgi:sulfotransferase family protein
MWALSTENCRRRWPLEGKSLCAEARRRTKLEDFGDPEIERRLFVLTTCIEREANLHLLGRFLARMHFRDLLETRLRLTDLWKSKAGDAKRIERPIFITGMPRSGSTFLHELLIQDIGNRAPLVWEVMFPLPLRERKSTEVRRRINRTAARLWWFRRLAPGADAVHPLRATTPHECVAIHSYTLLSQEFTTIFRVPGYEAFLNSADLTPTYEWQKRFLQHLQARGSTRRWVLKAPDHVFSLEALFRIFPDATIIQMHRNPIEVLKSSIRLTTVLREMFARPDNGSQAVAREAKMLAEGAERMTRFRDSHPELSSRFLDVNYTELISDPLGTIRRLYCQLKLPLTNSVAARVPTLAAYRCRYAHRQTDPTLKELGLDPRVEARRFESYCARFGIQQA